MTDRPPIPPHLWAIFLAAQAAARRGEWARGGQIIWNVTPEGEVVSCEVRPARPRRAISVGPSPRTL